MAINSTNFYSTQYLAGYNNLNKVQNQLSASIAKLSSGNRLAVSYEDPSALHLANKFETRVRGIRDAIGNTEDAISITRVASDAVADATTLLNRMRDLTLRVMNSATISAADASSYQKEFSSLRTEVYRKAFNASFNTKKLLSIAMTSGAITQIGPDNSTKYRLTFVLPNAMTASLGAAYVTLAQVYLSGDGVNSAAGHAASAIGAVSNAIRNSADVTDYISVMEVKLTLILNDLRDEDINISAAKSNITDTDMAEEITKMSKLQIISQAAVSVLAQADNISERAIKLLESIS